MLQKDLMFLNFIEYGQNYILVDGRKCRAIIYFFLTPLEFWNEDSIKLVLVLLWNKLDDQITNSILDDDAYVFKTVGSKNT